MNKLKRPLSETQMPLILAGGALLVLIIIIVVFLTGGEDNTERLVRLENAVGSLETRVQEMDLAISRLQQKDDVVEMLINKVDRLDETSPERIDALEKQLANLQQQLAGTENRPEAADETESGAAEEATPPADADEPPVKRPATPKNKVDYHEVKAGETLYQISRRYDLSVEELRRLNNLEEGALIRPGQKLIVGGRNR
jgi:LysM repeat protein